MMLARWWRARANDDGAHTRVRVNVRRKYSNLAQLQCAAAPCIERALNGFLWGVAFGLMFHAFAD